MEYMQNGARNVWHFSHMQSDENMFDNWVTVVRDSDQTRVVFALSFDQHDIEEGIDIDFEDGENMSIHLICISGSGTRIIADPFVPSHYIVAFFNCINLDGEIQFHFFSYQTRPGFQHYPTMAFSNQVNSLTLAQFNHPLGMVMPMPTPFLAFLSLRDNMPVYMMQDKHRFYDVFPDFEHPLQLFGPEFEEISLVYYCGEGYVVVVDTRELQIQNMWYGNIRRVTLGSVRVVLDHGVPKIISVVPNDLIPDDFAMFQSYKYD
ncbi:hypothetical protein E3N88_00226 [Mikania micrantha]|uniref:Uncharacterized protein n=1 Tax=Mikania micrantha TaxID=192012 RepID=A0A5N6Q074_9ASTR|nr:hypothetical protein E3N88_42230 [Mikania micrantha]KAD7477090.1 hypothetical protein E3N88_00226 [Mikania micrantha]